MPTTWEYIKGALGGDLTVASKENKSAYLQAINSKASLTGENSEDAVLRELGIREQLYKEKKGIEAISDPKEYLKQRSESIEKLSKAGASNFPLFYGALLEVGKPEEVAKKQAMIYTKTVVEALVNLVNQEYPISDRSISSATEREAEKALAPVAGLEGMRDIVKAVKSS